MRDYFLQIDASEASEQIVYLEHHERALVIGVNGTVSVRPLDETNQPSALLRRQSEGYQIQSCEGTQLRINGRDQTRSRLVGGDVIELGDVRFTFCCSATMAPVLLTDTGDLAELGLIRSTQSLRRGASGGELSHRMLLLFKIWDMLQLGRSEQEVCHRLIEILFQALPLRRGVVALRNEAGQFEPLVARNMDDPAGTVEMSRQVIEMIERTERAMLAPGPDSRRQVLSVICVPLLVGNELIGLVYIDNLERARSFDQEDLEYCSLLTELAALTMEKHQLQEQELYKLNEQLQSRQLKIGRDLRLAHEVQRSLVPEKMVTEQVEIAVRYIAMTDVGGDLLIIEQARRSRTFIAICDVSGHGVAAALMASRIAGEARLRARQGAPLLEMVQGLNSMLHRAYGNMGLFATFLGGYIDHDHNRLELIGAGHVPLIHLHDHETRLIGSRNMPLGMLPDCLAENPIETIQLAPDDLLLFYSDGFIESRTPEGALFGPEQLRSLLIDSSQDRLDAEEIANKMLLAESRHRGDDLQDDLSLLVVKILG